MTVLESVEYFRHRLRGFTLLELLVVITIMAAVIVLVAPSITGVVTANRLTFAEQIITAQINSARQTAVSQSLPVEVRFYSFVGELGDTKAFHAIQIFQVRPNGTYKALGKVQTLPAGITMLANGSEQRSTMLEPQTDAKASDPEIPGARAYSIARFNFQPDGSTNLSVQQSWHVTLAKASGNSALPANFATVQVDPLNGTTRAFRP